MGALKKIEDITTLHTDDRVKITGNYEVPIPYVGFRVDLRKIEIEAIEKTRANLAKDIGVEPKYVKTHAYTGLDETGFFAVIKADVEVHGLVLHESPIDPMTVIKFILTALAIIFTSPVGKWIIIAVLAWLILYHPPPALGGEFMWIFLLIAIFIFAFAGGLAKR